jgi:hypothetical protein
VRQQKPEQDINDKRRNRKSRTLNKRRNMRKQHQGQEEEHDKAGL